MMLLRALLNAFGRIALALAVGVTGILSTAYVMFMILAGYAPEDLDRMVGKLTKKKR